jgi:hypothetical protein
MVILSQAIAAEPVMIYTNAIRLTGILLET